MILKRRNFLAGCASTTLVFAGCRQRSRLWPNTGSPTEVFFAAVERGDVAAVAAAVSQTPSLLDSRDARGRSGFAVALLADRAAVADLLRDRGYQPDLVESAWIGDWERFDALAKGHPDQVNADHPLGGAAMYAAARAGHGSELWRVYARCGQANPPGKLPSAFSPLRAAFEVADLGAAEITAATLLANAADPNTVEAGGSSPLHAAAARGSSELVEMLVRKGAAVDAVDDAGQRPGDLAAAAGHHAIVALLTDNRAIPRDHLALRRAFDASGAPYRPASLSDVSIVDQRSFVGMGHSDLKGIRRRLAADPRLVHATATTSEIAVEAASHVGRVDIAKHLLERGAPLSMPTAILLDDIAAVRGLLEAASDRIHERGPHDYPLLWYPVLAGGSLDMMELLMQRGAEIKWQHYLGITALHFAARAGQLDMVALLVERGADLDRVGRKFHVAGQTPLELAESRGHRDIVRLLKERGARRH